MEFIEVYSLSVKPKHCSAWSSWHRCTCML